MRLAALAIALLPFLAHAKPIDATVGTAAANAVSARSTVVFRDSGGGLGDPNSSDVGPSGGSGGGLPGPSASGSPIGAEPGGIDAMKALVKRRFPQSMQNKIDFKYDTSLNGDGQFDAFSVDTKTNNKVTISSATVAGMGRGLLDYVRKLGHDVTWSGTTFTNDMASQMNTMAGQKYTGSSWASTRYFLNVVTYSYTLAFYNWDKWEYLLDWAILHEVFRDFGLTDDVILPYFSGPAFHSWARMGNIRGSWGQTVSQDWLTKQFNLQRKIINRMVAFSMKPVLPGFSGFVPAELHDKIGGPDFLHASAWMAFPDQYTKNSAIDPTWPTWNVVQKAFLEKQKSLYGGWLSGYYSIDLYNELRPTSTDPAYLRNNSANVIKSIRDVDPTAVWVMQGWLFVNDPKSWTPEHIEAFLASLADDQIIILDLASESMPVWSRVNNFYGKKWVWNTLLNYGQNNGLYGALDHYNSEVMKAKASGGNLIGTGLTPEGLNQNEHLFEMAMDTAWQTTQIDVSQWASDWVKRRYALNRPQNAKGTDAALKAWSLLDNSVYKSNDLEVACTTRSIFDLPPDVDGVLGTTGNYLATKITYNVSDVVAALDSLLAAATAAPQLEKTPGFSYDLVDVARQVFLNAGIPLYQKMIAAWKTGNDPQGVQVNGGMIVDLLKDVDAILATDKNFLLATWIADARQWGDDPMHQQFMEYQARNQIVLWGPATRAPWALDRYAAKHWHGVVGDVFAKSWELFWMFLIKNPPSAYKYATWTTQLQQMETDWQSRTWGASPNEYPSAQGSPVQTIKAMRKKWAKILA